MSPSGSVAVAVKAMGTFCQVALVPATRAGVATRVITGAESTPDTVLMVMTGPVTTELVTPFESLIWTVGVASRDPGAAAPG